MYKENKDTMQAINSLAKCLKIKPDRFSYAGTKDGRAITVQCVSVFRIDARNLRGLNNVLNNVRVGNFEFKKTQLKLGNLKGNTFVVVLRNVDANDELIESAMSSLQNLGFINYYGLQRFGSSKNATHAIGMINVFIYNLYTRNSCSLRQNITITNYIYTMKLFSQHRQFAKRSIFVSLLEKPYSHY